MKINADLGRRAAALSAALPWQPSPDGSVDRRMLDRDGAEVARATSVVRYPPRSRFPRHVHGGGEEFLVLNGIFSDESGDYPAGCYVRNPPGSAHAPFSRDGCVIFVKLMQFDPGDVGHVVVDTNHTRGTTGDGPGLEEIELHRFGREHVRLVRTAAGTDLEEMRWPGGAEFFVLRGEFADEMGTYPTGAWLRLPAGTRQRLSIRPGTEFYLKTGHLARA
jgi:anti-sigma factor ChrR (cupin superfamily)